MTNKEYIQSILSRVGANETDTEILFAENPSLVPDTKLNLTDCQNALYDSFSSWIPMYSSLSEGDMSISWNWNSVKAIMSQISKKLNKDNPFDEIDNKPKAKAFRPWRY
ncbi:DUF6706 family protein [Chishuiella sp.]|uniref:DUF6706 family protein n=1 Tax=Chishuiella sp. TaxID=1969467 RepID=UPI0028A7AFEF|nr:DUF6706 family protein [Chishuiella sp.]